MAKAAKKAAAPAKAPTKRTRKPKVVVPEPTEVTPQQPKPESEWPVEQEPAKEAKQPFYKPILKWFSGPYFTWKIIGICLIVLFVIIKVNGCNSADKIKEKGEKNKAPAYENLAILNDSLAYWKGAYVGAEARVEIANRKTDAAMEQLELVMEERNLSAVRQQQVRQTIKKQTDETTKRINETNSFADLDRLLDSIRRARKEGAIN